MTFASLGTAALWASMAASACGGPTPQIAKPVARPAPSAKPEPVRLEPDLTPVARPENVIAIGRISRPAKVLGKIAEWRGESGWTEVVDELARGLGDLARADAPLDVVVSLERNPPGPLPDVSTLISIGLESRKRVERELRAAGSIHRELAPGVWLISEGPKRPCAVAAAAGAAPVRLVCASSRAALDELLPYATRGLTREPPPPEDLGITLDVARARALHGERLATLERLALPFVGVALADIDPRLDRALSPLASSIFGELLQMFGDLDRIEATASFEQAHVDATARATFAREPQSFFAQSLFELAPRQAPPPDAFFQLPFDAHFAFYSHGMKPARAETLRRTIAGALSRATRARVSRSTLDLVVEALFPEPPFVYAFGLVDPPQSLEQSSASQLRWRSERVLGWHVIGIETDAKQLEKRLDRGMREYNTGPLRELAYAEFPHICAGLPKITRRPAPRKGLPAGSLVYEMLVPGKLFEDCARQYYYQPPGKTLPLGIAVVFAPGKPRSWMVVSPDTDFAIAKLREVLAMSKTGGLASLRPELGSPGLFGATMSTDLVAALAEKYVSIERLGPPRARSAWSVSIEGPRALRVSGRLPRDAFGGSLRP